MIDIEQARDKIEEILSRDEYRVYLEDNRSLIQKWWDSVKEWITNLFADLFSSINPANGFATGLVVLMLVVVILLILVAGFFAVRNWRRKITYRNQAPLYQKHERDWGFGEHFEEAIRQEAARDYQLATRHLFLALLLYFHEKGYIEARIWKTNWEYGQELGKTDRKLAESFLQLARIFDKVVYGEQTVEKESFLTYKEAISNWLNIQPTEELR
jgi:Domain of unknown function (DUF4129)